MEKSKIEFAVTDYQCMGCMYDNFKTCYEVSNDCGVGCGKHKPGTMGSNIGKFYLGLPRGFNRLGQFEKMELRIFESFEKFIEEWGNYDMFNVPVWKHKNDDGHILVRGMSPRRNEPFLHIFLEDCSDKINCLEISKKEISEMD